LRVSPKPPLLSVPHDWKTQGVDGKSVDWIPASAGMTERGVAEPYDSVVGSR